MTGAAFASLDETEVWKERYETWDLANLTTVSRRRWDDGQPHLSLAVRLVVTILCLV